MAKFRVPSSITHAFVATHNHFVLDRGGKVFKQTAPVIKLPVDASLDDHLGLLGLLNSSTACFWMQQVFHNKGGPGGASSKDEKWHDFYEHDGTKLKQFPLPEARPLDLARRLDDLAQKRARHQPATLAEREVPTHASLEECRQVAQRTWEQMIALQEELDWECYRLYGLLDEDLTSGPDQVPQVCLGERAFEIAMARRMAAEELKTKWFEKHRIAPLTEIPDHWPADYRKLVEKRIDVISRIKNIRLIEQPGTKRRWSTDPWENRVKEAVRSWLLDRLEEKSLWTEARLKTTARLTDELRHDRDLLQVAEIYAGRQGFDLAKLVERLVLDEAVPYLPVLRYKPTGLTKRRVWERTWDLQRQEDAIDARVDLPDDDPRKLTKDDADALKAREVGDIPVPPKYKSADFLKPTYWRLRGKLDVPKERFILYPGAERDADPSPVIGWAGWNHLQQAEALAVYHGERKDEGWAKDRLVPLLAGILDLVPWLKQWHNEEDPEYGTRMGDYYDESFLGEELRALELTREDLLAYQPPVTRKKRGRKKKETGGSG